MIGEDIHVYFQFYRHVFQSWALFIRILFQTKLSQEFSRLGHPASNSDDHMREKQFYGGIWYILLDPGVF